MTFYGFGTAQASAHYIPTLSLGERVALGYESQFERWHKFGFNADVDDVTEESVVPYGGLANFPLVATYPGAKMEVVSTSTDDDSNVAGIGARTVTIYYLTAAGVEKTEVVALDGTTPVETAATDIWRINGFRVKTMGTSQGAVGTITVQELDTAPKYSAIIPGATRAYNSQYTVPAGKRLFITDWECTSVGAVKGTNDFLQFRLLANKDYDGVASGVNLFEHGDMSVEGGGENRHFEVPLSFAAGTDIVVNCKGIAATDHTQAATYMQGYLITV
jgi:hypothetical protein